MAGTNVSFEAIAIDKPDDANVIIGQSHVIKTVEDLHEALVGVGGSLKFGLAFCEARRMCEPVATYCARSATSSDLPFLSRSVGS